MNILEQLEERTKQRLLAARSKPLITDFRPGDTLEVHTIIREGANQRVQVFKGVCIARRNRGLRSSFLVRKLSQDVGVEKRFMLYSPMVDEIRIVRHGAVRRAKLYYLRSRRGKAARLRERKQHVPASA
jgi:large subunit ribosomal protein L19